MQFQAELYYSPFKQLEISALGSARFVKTTQEVKLLSTPTELWPTAQ